MFIVSFKLGAQMSVVYPIYATTFIWAALIASYFEKEPINTIQILGMVSIVAGVMCITAGASR